MGHGTRQRKPLKASRSARPTLLLLSLLVLILAVSTVPALAQSSYRDAQSAYDKRDFKAAFKIAQSLAAEANADGQYLLGVLYENGEGVNRDTATAAGWYQRASDQDHGEAQLNLGVLYENGEGVEQSAELAVDRRGILTPLVG